MAEETLTSEEKFFQSLNFVAIHLIKNANSMAQVLIPLVESYNKKQWATLPIEKKREILQALSKAVAEKGLIGKHFKEYPHQNTRRKFQEFCEALIRYAEVLKKE